MTGFVAKAANAALYALAALPFIALSMAHAEPATVKYSDLNLSQPAQVQQFNARVDKAADKVCANYAEPRDLDRHEACTSAVRAEAMDKLNQQQASRTTTVASR